MKPVVDRLEQKYKGKIDFVRYDVDKDTTGSQLMQRLGAKYVPTFVFVNKDGSISQQKVGETSEQNLVAALDALR